MVLTLDTVSTELLLKIFQYLPIRDLCNLKQTCKRFNEVIEKWGRSLKRNYTPLVTNQAHPKIKKCSARVLSLFEAIRISKNWQSGTYKQKKYFCKRVNCLQLEQNIIWASSQNRIFGYARKKGSINVSAPLYNLRSDCNSDISKFVKNDDTILSAHCNGNLTLWSVGLDGHKQDQLIRCHKDDIHSVDMRNDVFVSGSRDHFAKIWRRGEEVSLLREINVGDRVWSVALCSNLWAVGNAGVLAESALQIYDLNCSQMSLHDFKGAGVLDIKWETPSVLWSCGYDTFLTKWDLRCGKCVQALEDPLLSAVYCFQNDNFNTILSGTRNNARVVLWDTRKGKHVQQYFMLCCERRNRCCRKQMTSPIFGLCNDAEYLFTATDSYLNILDFSIYNGVERDYRIY